MRNVLICAFILWPVIVFAQSVGQRMTVPQKCEIYKKLWVSLIDNTNKAEFSQGFLQSHDAFIAGGCVDYRGVCPTTAKDLEFANKLTVGAMSSGLASTFLPFKCSATR